MYEKIYSEADGRFLCHHGEAWDANLLLPALKPRRWKASVCCFRSLELLQTCWALLLIPISSPKLRYLFSLYFALLPILVLQYCSSKRELTQGNVYRHSEKHGKRKGKKYFSFPVVHGMNICISSLPELMSVSRGSVVLSNSSYNQELLRH